MGKAQKRARQKLNKQALQAERAALMRRRTIVRLVTILAVLGLVAAVAATLSLGASRGEGARQAESGQGAGESGRESTQVAAACEGDQPPEASPGTYEKPADVLQPDVDYAAVIETSCGTIEMDLAERSAPANANSFMFLAREGFYDGLTFHRVVEDFVIQAGDPNSNNGVAPDGPGYEVQDELPKGSSEYVFGIVAMANTGRPDSAGSQFFIVVHKGAGGKPEPAGLEPDYSIFGEVEPSSYDTIEKIATRPVKGEADPAESEEPVNPVYIESIEIRER